MHNYWQGKKSIQIDRVQSAVDEPIQYNAIAILQVHIRHRMNHIDGKKSFN